MVNHTIQLPSHLNIKYTSWFDLLLTMQHNQTQAENNMSLTSQVSDAVLAKIKTSHFAQ